MRNGAISLTLLFLANVIGLPPAYSQDASRDILIPQNPRPPQVDLLLETMRWKGAAPQQVSIADNNPCKEVLNLILGKSEIGLTPIGAASLIRKKHGNRIDSPRIGYLVVLSRNSTGNHVGIVRGTDGDGNPIVVSGNLGDKVAESVYPKKDVFGYFMATTCSGPGAR